MYVFCEAAKIWGQHYTNVKLLKYFAFSFLFITLFANAKLFSIFHLPTYKRTASLAYLLFTLNLSGKKASIHLTMNLNKYPVVSTNEHRKYEFLSVGPNGYIKKYVFYEAYGDDLYNLAFGDWSEFQREINDKVRSNNHDRDKVMATVAGTVIEFLKHYPCATVFAKGSTPSRTRLYQMGIFANWEEINKTFVIEGLINNEWQPFERNKNYQAFMARKK